MKLSLKLTVVFLLLFGFMVAAQTSANRAAIFNPTGDYHPLKRPAVESEKFVQFDLQVRRKKGKLIAWGEIRGVRKWHKFAFVSVTEKRLKFSTVKIDGARYDFEGKFAGRGDFASQFSGNGIVMLEGTLRKFVNGRKVFEISTSYLYYPGC